MLNKKIDNRGFGKKETMMALLLIVIFIGVVMYLFTNTHSSTKYTNFRRVASGFIDCAGALRNDMPQYEMGPYLYDTIKQGYSDRIESPFDSDEECDVYETRIKMYNNDTYLTMKCSNYLIYNQLTTAKKYKIYKVSDWTPERITGDNVQMVNFYNYEVDGKEQFPEYYIEKQFLVEYTNKNHYRLVNINSLLEGHKLLQKTYYRTMDEVA